MPTLKKVAGLIPRLRTPGGIVVARRGPPVKNEYGSYEPGIEQLIPIPVCVVHNLSGRDLQQEFDANYVRETIQVYTRERLYVADSYTQDADIIIYTGRRYKVVRVMDYFLQGGVYISIASLEDAPS